ncbi:MAG TPA: phosphate regulon sensor histidine kinase PhoR [Gallionellaceae bacterium]
MLELWGRPLIFLVILVSLTLLVWASSGALAAAMVFGALLFYRWVYHVRHLLTLNYWLHDPEGRDLPDASGPWQEVYGRIYKLVREHRKERTRRAAALHDMEQATSALPEGVVSLDKRDHIEWCNMLAERHLGLDGVRDVGQQITYLVRQPEFVKYLASGNLNEPLTLRGARQDDLILSLKLVPYGGNKRLLISRDITNFERIETMRRDFVANVSHELRTPLTVVNGFVETLHDMPNLENDMARRALTLMGEQTQRMESLVGDLLTLSKLEDKLNVLQEEVLDVPTLLPRCYQDGLALSGGQHNIRLDIQSDCKLLGCAEELRSAFSNLVSNAIRYTPAGGEIVMTWKLLDGGQPVFSVKDAGIGIAPQHISRLTERFYRVDSSRSRATGGTGLGLAIVKHIANRHQARLDIVSEEGVGSTFSIEFPSRRRR